MLGNRCWIYDSDCLNFVLEIVAVPLGAAEGNLTWASASWLDGLASQWNGLMSRHLFSLSIPQAEWAWSRNVKSNCRWMIQRITESRCQQPFSAERQSSGNCWGEKKKKKRTVETVICKMPEYLEPAPQGWTYFLWNFISCPPALFTFLGPVQVVLVDAVSWNSLAHPDNYCCCWWAAAWDLIKSSLNTLIGMFRFSVFVFCWKWVLC